MAGQKPDQASNQALSLSNQVADMLKIHDKLVVEHNKFSKMVLEDRDWFDRVLDTANYKLRSKRESWIAQKRMGLTNSGTLVGMENFKLATEKMGVDFQKLRELVESSPTRPLTQTKNNNGPRRLIRNEKK